MTREPVKVVSGAFEDPSLLGVIGGVGPHAGLDFVGKLFSNTRAACDQDHLSCALVSCPSLIPDRTGFLLQSNEEGNPAFGMFECARRLYQAGVRFVIVACNTAHAGRIFVPFCAMVRDTLPDLKIINLIESSALYVKEALRVRRLGLLATIGTHRCRVYHEYFREEEGFLLLEPDICGQEKIHEAIFSKDFGIKANSGIVSAQAKEQIASEIMHLIDSGAEAIILGCTELPLAVLKQDFPVPIIDPALLSARRLVSLVAPEKLLD
jgi:aspartate racemase